MMNSIDSVIAEVLIAGLTDIIQASEVAYITTYAGGAETDDQVRGMTLQAVRALLERGLMEIGDVVKVDNPEVKGYALDIAPWDLSPSEAVERVEREWLALGRRPILGELFWLINTERGNELAQKLLRERDKQEARGEQ